MPALAETSTSRTTARERERRVQREAAAHRVAAEHEASRGPPPARRDTQPAKLTGAQVARPRAVAAQVQRHAVASARREERRAPPSQHAPGAAEAVQQDEFSASERQSRPPTIACSREQPDSATLADPHGLLLRGLRRRAGPLRHEARLHLAGLAHAPLVLSLAREPGIALLLAHRRALRGLLRARRWPRPAAARSRSPAPRAPPPPSSCRR